MVSQITKEQYENYIESTYARFPLHIIKGENATCWGPDGSEYIDLTSGIGVNALGFANGPWVQAVTQQLGLLQHTSNLYYTAPAGTLAQMLCKSSGLSKVFFANSGAEANEAAIKAARKYSSDKYGPGRAGIITLENSFHGRTMATLTATGQDSFHQHFAPFLEGFSYTPANDIAALQAAITPATCAIILELVQGEGGVIPLEQAYVTAVASLCKAKDILLVVDEVQTGIGRTGSLFAYQQFGILPDIATAAKGLGGGLPIGAALFGAATAGVLAPGDHGSTYGGNPAACAGACQVLKQVNQVQFLEDVQANGQHIRTVLQGCPGVASISGLGLMLGITLQGCTSKDLAATCLKNGLLILTAKEKARLLPPLTITMAELDKGLQILKTSLEECIQNV